MRNDVVTVSFLVSCNQVETAKKDFFIKNDSIGSHNIMYVSVYMIVYRLFSLIDYGSKISGFILPLMMCGCDFLLYNEL